MGIRNITLRLSLTLLFPLVLLLSVSACVTQEQTTGNSFPQKTKQTWSVILSISGGFAGLAKNISIDSDGLIIINNLKNNSSIRNKINNKELGILSNLIHKKTGVISQPVSPSGNKKCFDCFYYKLSIRWQNGQQLVVLNDINLSKSPFKGVIIFLRKMISKYS